MIELERVGLRDRRGPSRYCGARKFASAPRPMERDSFFGDPIVWTGRPKVLRIPLMYRVGAWAFGVVALISTLSAIAVKTDRKSVV